MKSSIRTLFIVVGIFGVLATSIRAEDKAPDAPAKTAPKVDRDSAMEKIFAQLKLTAEQKVKVKKVFEERHEKVQALLKESVAQDEKRKKFKEIVDAGNAQIVKALTAEQQEIWKQIRAENSKSIHSAEESKKKE